MKSLFVLHSVILIRIVSFTRSSVDLLIPWRLLVLFIWFVWFVLLTHDAYSSSQNPLPCPNVIGGNQEGPQLSTSSELQESPTSLAPLTRPYEARRRSPQEPEIFKQLPEPLLRALNELARMHIAADESLATGKTTQYSEGNAPSPVAATQGHSLFQEAIGNRLKAHHLEIKTRELKDELTKLDFFLNDDQWMDLLQHQIYLIQNQERGISEGKNSSREDETQRHAQEWNKTERADQQQELTILRLAVKWIHEAQYLDQKSNDRKYQNSHRLGEDFFTTSEWVDHPDRLLALIDLRDQDILRFIIGYILPQDVWKAHPQVVTNLIERSGTDQWTLRFIAYDVLSKEYWAKCPESPSWLTTLLQQAGNDQWTLQIIALHVLSKKHWANHPESPSWLNTLIQQAGNNQQTLRSIAKNILSKEYWAKYPESLSWVTTLIQQAGNDELTFQSIAEHILSRKYWANDSEFPSWITTLLQLSEDDPWRLQLIAYHVLSKEYWKNYPQLKALVRWGIIPRSVTVKNILAALDRGKLLPSPLLPMLPTPPTTIPTSSNSPIGGIRNGQADPEKSDAADTTGPVERTTQLLDFQSEYNVQIRKE